MRVLVGDPSGVVDLVQVEARRSRAVVVMKRRARRADRREAPAEGRDFALCPPVTRENADLIYAEIDSLASDVLRALEGK